MRGRAEALGSAFRITCAQGRPATSAVPRPSSATRQHHTQPREKEAKSMQSTRHQQCLGLFSKSTLASLNCASVLHACTDVARTCRSDRTNALSITLSCRAPLLLYPVCVFCVQLVHIIDTQGLLSLASTLVRDGPLTSRMYEEAMSPFLGPSAEKKTDEKTSEVAVLPTPEDPTAEP